MKTLSASQSLPSGASSSRFQAAKSAALALAASDRELREPEVVAWIDRPAGMTSPVLEGCGGPRGWHDYGVSHGGCLEVDVAGELAFIFADSGDFDSYADCGPGPYVNLRDAQGNESICRVGGKDCVSLDDWTSKLT